MPHKKNINKKEKNKNIYSENIIESENINLGGFPPIIYINDETKKKREFRNEINDNININNIKIKNILNIKNILKDN
jgi:hypothetical protein